MASRSSGNHNGLTVTAHVGDFKTLLAFSFDRKARTARLAGFTVKVQPAQGEAYFLWNTLQFANPARHVQDASEPAQSTLNAPLHAFRWLHVPGSVHSKDPPAGDYTYTVTPRYFDTRQSMQQIDDTLAVAVTVPVKPFGREGRLALGFTRGYTQSQAFQRHFSRDTKLRPDGDDLVFDTNQVAGQNSQGQDFSFADMYDWSGFTARKHVLSFLDAVLADKKQFLDAFCYDLSDPDVCRRLLDLAAAGRVRVVLDNAALHVSQPAKPATPTRKAQKATSTPEDDFERQFNKRKTGRAAILRGHFGRYAHDKVFVAFTKQRWLRVLTGSTNFSITGLAVNSNHVLVFDDAEVAEKYGALFEAVWNDNVSAAKFIKTSFSRIRYVPTSPKLPKTTITFSPHSPEDAQAILSSLAARVENESSGTKNRSVLFAVMELAKGESPALAALKKLPASSEVFTYGITDSSFEGITLYNPGAKTGVTVTGKPTSSMLPPPFDQIRFLSGFGHQVHHKFVVCGFNGDDPTVYCGSSNLALGGEHQNGDNLLEIHDGDVATVFAIEAIGLVDHFLFLNRLAREQSGGKQNDIESMPSSKAEAAKKADWHLSTTDAWAAPYYDPNDLKFVARELFVSSS